MDASSGQLVRDFRLAECGTEQFDLLGGIANEIRESIHRRSGLEQRVIVSSPKPRSDRTGRLRSHDCLLDGGELRSI